MQASLPAHLGLLRNRAHEVAGHVHPACHGSTQALFGQGSIVKASQLAQLAVIEALDAKGEPRATRGGKPAEQPVGQRVGVGLAREFLEAGRKLPHATCERGKLVAKHRGRPPANVGRLQALQQTGIVRLPRQATERRRVGTQQRVMPRRRP